MGDAASPLSQQAPGEGGCTLPCSARLSFAPQVIYKRNYLVAGGQKNIIREVPDVEFHYIQGFVGSCVHTEARVGACVVQGGLFGRSVV